MNELGHLIADGNLFSCRGSAKTINVSAPDDPSQQSEEFLELANGCLCCSIKDSGIAAIEKLMQRKGAFDHILLETTGLADPGPIASMFWQNEEFSMGLGRDIHLDGVVCVVDAVFGRKVGSSMSLMHCHSVNITISKWKKTTQQTELVKVHHRQIAGADVILLNKVDLVSLDELEATEDLISGINPAAAIHRTVRSNIDLKYIMGVDAYSSARPFLPHEPMKHSRCGDEHDHGDPSHAHSHDHGLTHYEIRGISSLQVSCPVMSASHMGRFDEWIRTVLWEHRLPDDSSSKLEILRCKGIFKTDNGELHVLQGVRNLYEIAKVEAEGPADIGLPDAGKLVFIGKGLDDRVRHSLKEVLKTS
ncbi:COBW domain-containing protein 1 [Grifola frondosa]|uniref:COBW domain-containing protein 1 n=1 Tax=Grifola frondosa TaxID=5627 RepID=A0A1C7M1S4_GRIFR|nr:COBW domain-containing protein 1 [Grifola frondosa]